jgi:hypothetical protein
VPSTTDDVTKDPAMKGAVAPEQVSLAIRIIRLRRILARYKSNLGCRKAAGHKVRELLFCELGGVWSKDEILISAGTRNSAMIRLPCAGAPRAL